MPPRTLVVRATANLRAGPGRDHERVGAVAAGETVTAFGQQGDWYQVAIGDGAAGWIHQAEVEPRSQ